MQNKTNVLLEESREDVCFLGGIYKHKQQQLDISPESYQK